MVRDGLQAASSLAPARGIAAITGMAMVTTDAVDMVTTDAATTDPARSDTTEAVGLVMAAAMRAAQSAEVSMVAAAAERLLVNWNGWQQTLSAVLLSVSKARLLMDRRLAAGRFLLFAGPPGLHTKIGP